MLPHTTKFPKATTAYTILLSLVFTVFPMIFSLKFLILSFLTCSRASSDVGKTRGNETLSRDLVSRPHNPISSQDKISGDQFEKAQVISFSSSGTSSQGIYSLTICSPFPEQFSMHNLISPFLTRVFAFNNSP